MKEVVCEFLFSMVRSGEDIMEFHVVNDGRVWRDSSIPTSVLSESVGRRHDCDLCPFTFRHLLQSFVESRTELGNLASDENLKALPVVWISVPFSKLNVKSQRICWPCLGNVTPSPASNISFTTPSIG